MLQISTQTTAFRQTNGGFAYEVCLKTLNLRTDNIKNRTLRSHTHTHRQSSKSVYLALTRGLCSCRMESKIQDIIDQERQKCGTPGLDLNNSFYWKKSIFKGMLRSDSATL